MAKRSLNIMDFLIRADSQALIRFGSASSHNDNRSKLLQKLFKHFDFKTIKTIAKIPLFKRYFIQIVKLQSLDLDFASVLWSLLEDTSQDDVFDDTSELRIRDHYSLFVHRPLQSLAPFWSLFMNVVVLDVSFCRSITDHDMQLVLTNPGRKKGFISLCFAGCPLISNLTLQTIEKTQRDLVLLAFTIPKISFNVLFRILGSNPKLQRVRLPTHDYPGLKLDRRFPAITIESGIFATYGEMIGVIKSNAFSPEIIEPAFSRAPIITAITGNSQQHEEELLFDSEFQAVIDPSAVSPLDVGNHSFLLTTLIVTNDLFSFKKCLENIGIHSLLPYFLHAIEIVGQKILDTLPSFVEIVILRQEFLNSHIVSECNVKL